MNSSSRSSSICLVDLGLDGALAVLAEGQRSDLLGEPPVLWVSSASPSAPAASSSPRTRRRLSSIRSTASWFLLDRLAVGARHLLELPPDVVDLDGGVLAVEHPGPDLDRPTDRAGGLLAGLRTLAHHLRRGLVSDLHPLDDDPVADQADGPVSSVDVEGQLWLFRGFHMDSRR